ncbi:hypothetical protein [Salinisphaera aquimarina]|uniref:Uncharacterized protein n=1 Tax=Salinisphaera aquimarina TaxID=2094031 RepID=A0ABV7EKE8_9GAMM
MKKGIIIAVVVLAAIAASAYWFETRSPTPGPSPTTEPASPAPETNEGEQNTPPANAGETVPPEPNAQAEAEPAPPPPPKDFCARDFADVEAREADASRLKAQGGLVHIFEREAQLADPYGCADFYLQHGLDIDATDPRSDHEPLSGLFFAIQRNDPKMLNFMIDHGADLKKRAGKKDTRALGYAYYLALNDTRINRNEVIGILDAALTRQAENGASTAAGDKP